MKKTLVAVLLIAAICIPAFADKAETPTKLTLSVKLNLGTKASSKQISSIEFSEILKRVNYDIRTFEEKASFLYSFEDKKDNTLSIDLAYLPALKVESETVNINKTFFGLNFTGSNKNGKFQGRTLSFVSAISFNYEGKNETNVIGATDYDYSFAGDSNLPSTKLGFTYSFDHDPTVTGVDLGFKIQKTGLKIKSLISKDSEGERVPLDGATGVFKASASFHLIDKQIKISNAYIGGEIDSNIGAAGMTYKLGYKYSYDNGPEVNGVYTNLLYNNAAVNFADVSANVGIVGEASLHLVNNKLQFQLNKLRLSGNGYPLVKMSVSSDASGAQMNLGNIEYVYSAANTDKENGVFSNFYVDTWYKPQDVVKITTAANIVLHTFFDGDNLKTELNTFSIQGLYYKCIENKAK